MTGETNLAFHFLGVLFYLLLDLIRQLIQLTLCELQQLAFLLEFLLAQFPDIIHHAMLPTINNYQALTVRVCVCVSAHVSMHYLHHHRNSFTN